MIKTQAIFLHSGMRSGGSALSFAFKQVEGFRLYYDPFNPAFFETGKLLDHNTSDWASNHTENQLYFEEYGDLLNTLRENPFELQTRYDYFGIQKSKEFINRLNIILDKEKIKNVVPIIKLETSEGRIKLLKNCFPRAFHFGIIRDIEMMKNSWLEQAALGNLFFHSSALNIIKQFPMEYPKNQKNFQLSFDENSLNEIFYAFENKRRELLIECDAILDMTNEASTAEGLELITEYLKLNLHSKNIIKMSLSRENDSKNLNTKFSRSISTLIIVRNEVQKLLEENKQINAEIETIRNSQIFRSLRFFGLLRGNLKFPGFR